MKPTAENRCGVEQLIGALVPAPLPKPRPVSAPLPVLPEPRPPARPELPVLDIARLDRSGRLSARPLLTALGWRTDHRVDIDAVDGLIVITSTATGGHAVGARGELALPAAARRLCGLAPGHLVVLAGYPCPGLVVIHPASAVAVLLREAHARLIGGDHVG